MSSKKIRDKMSRIAAHMLEVKEAELELEEGSIRVIQNPDRAVSFEEIATLAYKKILLLPEDVEPGLMKVLHKGCPSSL